jgi:hypothetical protein
MISESLIKLPDHHRVIVVASATAPPSMIRMHQQCVEVHSFLQIYNPTASSRQLKSVGASFIIGSSVSVVKSIGARPQGSSYRIIN